MNFGTRHFGQLIENLETLDPNLTLLSRGLFHFVVGDLDSRHLALSHEVRNADLIFDYRLLIPYYNAK